MKTRRLSHRSRSRRSLVFEPLSLGLLVASLATGCNGVISGPDDGATNGPGTNGPGGPSSPSLDGQTPDEVLASPECQAPQPGRAPLRRLSNFDYANSVKDLFASVPGMPELVDEVVSTFPAESESLGFRNSADLLTVGSLVAEKYMDAAEAIAAKAASAPELLPCEAAAGLDCARQLIRELGARAYRRPLTDAEVQTYEGVFNQGAEEGFEVGVEWVVFAMLQSTHFLHRVELGRAAAGAYTQPSPHEMASRLSYLIWHSVPDQALIDAANSGKLETAEELAAQARRMLADAKSERLLQYFEQWLDVDVMSELERDPAVYPNLNANLGELLREETRAFVKALLASPSGSFRELITAQYTYANADLAQHYGLSGATGPEFVRVDAPGRSGVLTQGMMLAHDKESRTSIVRRGLKVRIDLLCQIVPAPPPDVNINLEGQGSGLTQRERLEQHRAEPSCAGCHELMDPLGVTFESFDAVGRFRTVDELGKPVVTASEVSGTRDANGPVANAVELGELIAQSQEARECYVLQNFRYFYGRDAKPEDKCSMAQLYKAFDENQHNLAELLVALTQTDAFRYRPVITPEASP